MISPFAFATSLALLTAVLFVLFLVLGLVAPGLFKFLFNAQFFGADVASLLPQRSSFGAVVGTFVALLISVGCSDTPGRRSTTSSEGTSE